MDTDAFAQRLDELVDQGRTSEHTRETYVNAVRRFESWLESEYGDGEATPERVQAYLNYLADEGRSNSGIRTVYYGIKRYFSWEDRASSLESVDSHVSNRYRVGGESTPDYFTEDEIGDMKEAAREDPRDAAIVYLFSSTGMRVGELVGLGLDDVDLADKTIYVDRQKRNENIRDALPLDSEDITVLDNYLENRDKYGPADETDAFFITRSGRMSTDTAQRRVTLVAERAEGIDPDRVHPHLFRHSVGTKLAQNGKTATEIAHYLGHASASTSEKYVHLSDVKRRELRGDLGW